METIEKAETLLEYADRERHNDSWWEEVYEILDGCRRKGQSRPNVLATKQAIRTIAAAAVQVKSPVSLKPIDLGNGLAYAWKAYSRPQHQPQANAEAKPVSLSVCERPTQARTSRQTPIHKNVSIPPYVKDAKIAQQDNRCIYCERTFGAPVLHDGEIEVLEPHTEHFKPRAAGGRTVDSNIVYACHICNRLKSDYVFDTVEEVAAWLNTEWERKGYGDCPPLIPFKRHAMSYN